MKHKLFLVVVPLVIGLYSCQKEISIENVESLPSSPVIDSNFISKLFYIGTTGSTVDTLLTLTYSYDNLKRVTSIIGSSRDLYNAGQPTYHYSYNGTDTVPYKSTLFRLSAMDVASTQFSYDTTITYHTYNTNRQNLEDSAIFSHKDDFGGYSLYYRIKKYSYAPNKIYGLTLLYEVGTSTPLSQKDTASLDANENIINNRSYIYNSFTGDWQLNIISNFTYDNKINPFAMLSNFKTFGVFPNGETLFIECPQKNNRMTQNERHSIHPDGTGGIYYNYDYSNSYKNNGLIKETIINDQPPTPGTQFKVAFTYRTL